MKTIPITKWAEYKDLISSNDFKSWAFRGQRDSKWKLKSTLTRYFEDFGVDYRAWSSQEERILRIFKRKAHLYLNHIPEENDDFQWLSIMQHFGTPTRLIDFTWSPYVAAFFALESAQSNSAIWAIFPPRIDFSDKQQIRRATIINPRDRWMRIKGNYEKYFLPGNEPFVVTGEPHIMNQRLIAQSGTFAIPGKIDEPLEDLLNDYSDPEKTIVKIELNTTSLRDEAMWDLYNSNITNATLFPDINGMAKSLAYELEFHWAYNPKTFIKNHGFDNSPFPLPSGL
jgi:hypothetical protein